MYLTEYSRQKYDFFINCLLSNKIEDTVCMATFSVRQIEHQPFSAFILLPPDGCLVSATIWCWEMMWSTSHEHGTKKKCDFTTGIEPLSPGSTDKDWNPVPEILNPRRVLDFYLQPTYLSATSFPLKEKHDSGSGTHYILNIRLTVLAFFNSCIWLSWRSALWHKLLRAYPRIKPKC